MARRKMKRIKKIKRKVSITLIIANKFGDIFHGELNLKINKN
jgi:hypothetical protein